jgi:glycosyltransferase involved in cell wall biosynthesis
MRSDSLEVVVAYGDEGWKEVLDRLHIKGIRLRHWRRGETIAKLFMGAFLHASWARAMAPTINPLVAELRNLSCNAWIFPAQDALTWQMCGPTIATIHDLMHRYEPSFPEASSWWRYLWREHRFRNLANASTAVLVDSETGRNHVIESYGTPPGHIHSLPYVAPDYIYAAYERPRVSEHYQLPGKFLFYPAQFWPHKNHLRLVEALARARQACPDMELVLTGGANRDYEKVKTRVLALRLEQVVHFLGYVPDTDLASLYRRARGLIMPTFFGPTNIPPLEAMACGCPVLISNIYGIPEQCGDAALYFSPNSIDEMQRVMTSLWQDDALFKRLSAKGLERTASWRQVDFNKRLADIVCQTLRPVESSVATVQCW